MQFKGAIEPAQPGAELLCIGARLPLKGFRRLFPFMRSFMRVAGHSRRTSGLARFAMKTDLPRKTFWTITAWRDRTYRFRRPG